MSTISHGEFPTRFGFLLINDFTLISLASAVEPLRVANRLSGRQLYSWHIFSEDGEPVVASNGMSLVAEGSVASIGRRSAPR